MNQAVSFGLLLGGGVLLTSALTGKSLSDLAQGKGGSVPDKSVLSGGSTGPVAAAGGAVTNVGQMLGSALTGSYANPLAGAKVTPERIDQGVDYAGTGTIAAIGDAVVTAVFPYGSKGSGWPNGGYVEYQLTNGPDAGAFIYAAEGVRPTVKVGQKVSAGQTIASLVPGASTGIETGLGSGIGTQTWASQHGGYVEGQLTGAGAWFSSLLAQLGAQPGTTGGRKVTGQTPAFG